MTKQEAIRLLHDEIIRCRMAPKINGCQMTEEWQRTIEVCEIAIAAIRAQEERQWIPVEDRLPEPKENAICINRHGDMMIGTYTEWGWMFPCYFESPTHWMPLPELPKKRVVQNEML